MRLAEKRGGRYTVTVLVRLVQFERSGGLSKQQPALSFLIGNIAAAQRRFLSDCVWRPECFRFFLIGRIPGKGGRQVFQIDLKSGDAIYLQLKEQVVRLALAGALESGEQLPSVRVLARELGINPNTVAKAYQELETEGILCSVAGKGSFLTGNIQASAAVRQSAKEAFQKAAARAVQAGFMKEELTELLSEAYGKGEEK